MWYSWASMAQSIECLPGLTLWGNSTHDRSQSQAPPMLVCKYVDENDSSAMLDTNRSVAVTPGVNLRILLCMCDKAHKLGDPPWFWNSGQTSPEVQNRDMTLGASCILTIVVSTANSDPNRSYLYFLFIEIFFFFTHNFYSRVAQYYEILVWCNYNAIRHMTKLRQLELVDRSCMISIIAS